MENEDFGGYTDPVDNKSDNDYIKASDFENLKLSENVVYEGGGQTSFAESSDSPKKDFLESLGIAIPEKWVEDRAMLINTFIITGHIIVLEDIRKKLEASGHLELFDHYIAGRNAQIEDLRLDIYGHRDVVPGTDQLVEDLYKEHKFSANPEKRGSRKELKMITKHIFEQLSK